MLFLSFFTYAQEHETKRILAMSHSVMSEAILFGSMMLLEVTAVLLYGIFIQVLQAEVNFIVIVAIATTARIIPNLIVFLSLFPSLKKYLLRSTVFTLSFKFVLPFKWDILFFTLLRSLEYFLYYCEEYLLYFCTYFINIYHGNSIEALQNT